jgi:hypothetical protein
MIELNTYNFGRFFKNKKSLICVLASVLICSILIIFSKNITSLQDGDDSITSLMSLYRVTIFYWGQNRMANVVPALASIISDIYLNIKYQYLIHAIFGFSIILLPLIVRKFRDIFARFAIITALIFLLMNDHVIFINFFHALPYGGGCFFFGLSLCLTDRVQRSTARTLLLLVAALSVAAAGMAMNPALLFLVTPFYLQRALLLRRLSDLGGLAIQLAGFGIAFALMLWVGGDDYSSLVLDWRNVVSAWNSAALELPLSAIACLILAALISDALALVRSLMSQGKSNDFAAATRVSLISSCLIAALAIINLGHIAENWSFRYICWLILLAIAASIDALWDRILLLAPSLRIVRPTPLWQAGAMVLMLGAVAWRTAPWTTEQHYLFPSRDYQLQELRDLAVAAKADIIIADDYWLAWPLLHEIIATRQRQGEAQPRPFAISFRGEAVKDLVDQAFRHSRQQRLFCAGDNLQECKARYFSYIAPFDWQECAQSVGEGRAGGTNYRVIDLIRREEGQVCDGDLIASPWSDLTEFIRLRPIAHRQDHRILVAPDGPSDLAVYGPYFPLAAGSYRALWRFSALDLQAVSDRDGVLQIDVVDNFGHKLLAQRTLTKAELQQAEFEGSDIALDFSSTSEIAHCEVRLVRLAPVAFSIDAIRVSFSD